MAITTRKQPGEADIHDVAAELGVNVGEALRTIRRADFPAPIREAGGTIRFFRPDDVKRYAGSRASRLER